MVYLQTTDVRYLITVIVKTFKKICSKLDYSCGTLYIHAKKALNSVEKTCLWWIQTRDLLIGLLTEIQRPTPYSFELPQKGHLTIFILYSTCVFQ